ncbi:murein biosynthesis integral membrane protein MurJ [Thioalkalivibrio sp. HK1]|uniref:murein biosynthesis integral membrane protein MurJ n=1 Tax=Thioalkalivibrio sp. HK1 TaxID=1469245 RepID=UPI000471ADAC|nr:murein biosynthesis integral membrane protein MurJ [Thioalkalivibrio sp. HK1]
MSQSLLKSVAAVGAGTTASRVLGFVRDILIARVFGAGAGADAFFVAFRIPNFLRRLFAEGAFSQAFVPILSEYRAQRSPEDVRDLLSHVLGALAGGLSIVTVVGVVSAPLLILVFAPGFSADPEKYELAVQLVRITFPYALFISLVAFAGGVLNAFGRFAVPAYTPVFLNLCLIAAVLWLAPVLEQPALALAVGVFVAGIVQLAFQFPFLAAIGMFVRPRWRRAHEGVGRVIKLMIPALFGVSVSQINLLVDTVIASFLVTGSVSWLYFSDRMMEFPLGIFGIALATVILPHLSRQHARTLDPANFSNTIDWALRLVLVIATPAAVGLAILAVPIIASLFHYGAFTAHDVQMTVRSLIAFSAGLIAFVAVKVLVTGFFSRQDTRTPVRIGMVAMVANVILNLLLMKPLAHAGLALATTVCAFLNAGLLLRSLLAQDVYRPRPGWIALISRVFIANALLAAGLWFAQGDVARWLEMAATERALRLTLLVFGGAVVYALIMLALGLRPHHLAMPAGGGAVSDARSDGKV